MMTTDLPELSSSESRENHPASGVFARGVFTPVIPMSMSYRRARSWAARVRAGRLDAKRLELMRAMERRNRG